MQVPGKMVPATGANLFYNRGAVGNHLISPLLYVTMVPVVCIGAMP